MGRQTRFHMFPEDCHRFISFLQERDPVIVTEWHSSQSSEIEAIIRPWECGGMYCLWNQAIIPTLSREATGQFFNISFKAPVIEFSYASPAVEPWHGQPSTIQGRIGRALKLTTSHSRVGTTPLSDGYARTSFRTGH